MLHDKHDLERWDKHADRQISAGKGAATAITLLNSGSWLALLSQASKLTSMDIGGVFAFWGFGALLGTSIWGVLYVNALLLQGGEERPKEKILRIGVWATIFGGVSAAIAALYCFGAGVISLSNALSG